MLPWNLLIIGNFDGEINNFVSISVAIAHGYDKYVPYNNLYKGMYGFYYLVKVTTYVHKDYKYIYYCILSYTCSIWAGTLYWLDNVLLYTVTGRNIVFFWYLCHLLPVELWEPNCTSSSLSVGRKYQKAQSRDNYILLLFNSKYKRQWINVCFFCRMSTISIQCLKV